MHLDIYPMNPGDPVVSTDFTSTTTSFKLSDLQVGFFQGATYEISTYAISGNIKGPESTCTITSERRLHADFCGTGHLMDSLIDQDSVLGSIKEIREEQFSRFMDQMENNSGGSRSGHHPVLGEDEFVIPVVVHILHNGTSPNSNINYSRISAQIDELNRDFNFENTDPSIQGTKIRFCLAQSTWPNSIPWSSLGTGVMVYNTVQDSILNTSVTTQGMNNLLSVTHFDTTRFPFEKYLNIWVVESIDDGVVAGYSPMPLIADFNFNLIPLDGIVIVGEVFGDENYPLLAGAQKGKVLAHEVGHYLSLYHVFEEGREAGVDSATCKTEGDRVCDTPPCSLDNVPPGVCTGNLINTSLGENLTYPYVPYLTFANSDSTDANDHIENHMYYSEDQCRFTFTPGQAFRMEALMQFAPHRANLTTLENLADVGVAQATSCVIPRVDATIKVLVSNVLCIGDSFTFINPNHIGNAATSWEWDFGDDSAHAFSDTVTHTYAATGVYTVTLTAMNATDTIVDSVLVWVRSCESLIRPEFGHWYYGVWAGWDFSSGSPVFDYGSYGNTNHEESACVQSSKEGDLLFYTSVSSVFDRNHQLVLPAGVLDLDYTTSQTMSVPFTKNKYMIVSPSAQDKNFPVRYTVVSVDPTTNMVAIDNSNISKTIPTPANMKIGEQVTAVPHANGRDHWLFLTGYDKIGDASYILVYRVTEGRITNACMTDSLPDLFPINVWSDVGGLEGSEDGSHIALAAYGHNLQYPISTRGLSTLSFDNFTGILSNEVILDTLNNFYSSCFSKSGNFLFSNGRKYDLATRNVIYTFSSFNELQMGPDGVIYLNANSGIIPLIDPEGITQEGPNQFFTEPAMGQYGFPNFIDARCIDNLTDPDFEVSYRPDCYTVDFMLDSGWACYDVIWDFGDGSPQLSGKLTSGSPLFNPSHTYMSGGTYVVTLTISVMGTVLPIREIEVNITEGTDAIIEGDTLTCNGQLRNYIVSNLGDSLIYHWSVSGGIFANFTNLRQSNSVEVIWTGLTGTLNVWVENPVYPCDSSVGSITVYIDSTIVPIIDSLPYSLCISSSPLQLSANYSGGIWYGDIVSDSVNGWINPSLGVSGPNLVTYVVHTGCFDTATIVINLAPENEWQFDVFMPNSIDFCFDSSIVLRTNLAPGDSATWYDTSGVIGVGDSLVVPATGGWYSATNINAVCGIYTDTILVLEQNKFVFEIRTPEGIVMCGDSSIKLNTNAPDDFINYIIWNSSVGFNASTPSVEVTQTGYYYATLITTTGCVYRDTIRIIGCCEVDTTYMLNVGGLYEALSTNNFAHLLTQHAGIKNISVGGNTVIQGHHKAVPLVLDGYHFYFTQANSTITFDDSWVIMKNCTFESSCNSMWGGIVVHGNYWDGSNRTPSNLVRMENCRVEDAVKAFYSQADMTKLGTVPGEDHYDEPDNGINKIEIVNSEWVNNLQNIVIDNVNTCPSGPPQICSSNMVRIENNLFGLDGGLNLPPYAGYISENHIELGYVNEKNYNTDITVKDNTFEDCIKAIVLDNYYDNNGYSGIEDGSINIEEGNVFTNFYEGAIDLGNGGEESEFRIKDSEFNFPNANQITGPQNTGIISENFAIDGYIRRKMEVANCTFNGTYRGPYINNNITNQKGINNESGCADMDFVGNVFSRCYVGADIMVYGYEDAVGTRYKSILGMEENVFDQAAKGVNFKENGYWTFLNNQGVATLEPTEIVISMNCNEFIEIKDGTPSTGIVVEGGTTYMGDIGDCQGGAPSGNGWPVETKPNPDSINTWISPSNWISIDNNSSSSFTYYPFHNEFVADANSYSGIDNPLVVSVNPLFGCSQIDGITGLTCTDSVIVFASIVINNSDNTIEGSIGLGNGYPNPSSGVIVVPYVIIESFESGEIQVLDLLGSEILKRRKIIESEGEVMFDLGAYPNGTYLCRIIVDNRVLKNKLIGIIR